MIAGGCLQPFPGKSERVRFTVALMSGSRSDRTGIPATRQKAERGWQLCSWLDALQNGYRDRPVVVHPDINSQLDLKEVVGLVSGGRQGHGRALYRPG